MKRPLTDQEILEKAASFCAYQERSEQDVRQKLEKWSVDASRADQFIIKLKQEGFLDDQRFADAFVRGRFRLKKWGRIKIRHGLYRHGISSGVMETALEQIDHDEYLDTLARLMNERTGNTDQPTLAEKAKIFRFLSSRGFEYDLINNCWDDRFSSC